MRVVLTFLLCVLLAFAAAAASAQDAPAEGSIVSGKLVLGRSTFALPPGEWHVVATDVGEVTREGTKIGSTVGIFVVQYNSRKQFVAGLFHRVPTSSVLTRSWNDSLCERKHVLYHDAFAGRFDFPECLHVDHLVPWYSQTAAPPRQPWDRKVWDWFRVNKISLPLTVLSANYRNYFSGDYVIARLIVNPEAFGQERAIKKVWAESEWDPLTYDQDPKRKAFVENLKRWSYVMADNARATLRSRKPKDAMLPPLDELKVK